MVGAMQIAQTMNLSSPDFWSQIHELEDHPLFLKLHQPDPVAGRVIRILPRPVLAPLPASIPSQIRIDEVDDLLEDHATIMEGLRRLGEDRFQALFFGESGVTAAEIAQEAGLTADQVKRFLRGVIDRVQMVDAMGAGKGLPASIPGIPARELLASITREGNRLTITHLVQRRRYDIDERRLQELVSAQRLDPEEIAALPALRRNLEQINLRLNLLTGLVETALAAQKDYLLTGNSDHLVALEVTEAAGELGIDPGWASRLLRDKWLNIEGSDIPLRSLYITRRQLARRRGIRALALLLDRAAKSITANESPRLPSDRELAAQLAAEHRIKASRRTVALWRKELQEKSTAANNREEKPVGSSSLNGLPLSAGTRSAVQ